MHTQRALCLKYIRASLAIGAHVGVVVLGSVVEGAAVEGVSVGAIVGLHANTTSVC